MREIELLVIHHSASARQSTTTALIRSWHKERGWSDIGYHYVIEADGLVHVGREPHVVGAHCRGHNGNSLGICVVGDNTDAAQVWNPQQTGALRTLVESIRRVWPEIVVKRHCDLAATECPGREIESILA